MPVSNSIGYLHNVIMLDTIASFLTLSRSFTNPISQVANQFNSIITALSGATRIFGLMDEAPEADEGYVTLINTIENESGEIRETSEHTGTWAWKHPHHDGTMTLSKLSGEVIFEYVDFSYSPEKQILYDITLFAKPGQKIALVGATGAGKNNHNKLN